MAQENETDVHDDINDADEFEVVIDEGDVAEVELADAPSDDEDDAVEDTDDAADSEAAAGDDSDAPTAAEEDDEGEVAEPDDEPLPKRFAREKRLRDQIIAERDQIRDVAVRAVEVVKQRESEVEALQRQNAQLQRQFAETLDYAYDKDIAIRVEALRRVREEGDYDAEIKLQSEIDTLRFQQNQVRQAKAGLPAVDPNIVSQSQQPQAQPRQQAEFQPPPAAKEPPAPLAVKWLERNRSWFAKPENAGYQAFTLAEDSRLAAEGYDKNSPEYYRELDRRIDKAFPHLRRKPQAARSPVAPAASAPASRTPSNVVKLTKTDLSNMRSFGLDPTNKEHLREYARSKRSA